MKARWIALLAVAVVGFGPGCSSGENGEGEAGVSPGKASGGLIDRDDIEIAVVTHGQAADPFWSVVKNGVDAAAKDLGVKVNYSAPEEFDMVRMRQLIDAAVAKQPDGLAVSIPDPDALGESIKAAVAAEIPVVSLNSGANVAEELGVLSHVGQEEESTGVEAGERMREAGVTNALCINPEVGNIALDQRCAGFAKGLGGKSEILEVDLADPTGAQQRIEAALQSRSDVNGIMALGFTAAEPALAALEKLNLQDEIKLANFDPSPEVLQAVLAGEMLFSIDQQQFVQGYMPVQLLTLAAQYGLSPARSVPSGPSFITNEDAADVIELAKQGVR